MDQIIETLASGLGISVGWLAENGVLFAIPAIIWIALGVGRATRGQEPLSSSAKRRQVSNERSEIRVNVDVASSQLSAVQRCARV